MTFDGAYGFGIICAKAMFGAQEGGKLVEWI